MALKSLAFGHFILGMPRKNFLHELIISHSCFSKQNRTSCWSCLFLMVGLANKLLWPIWLANPKSTFTVTYSIHNSQGQKYGTVCSSDWTRAAYCIFLLGSFFKSQLYRREFLSYPFVNMGGLGGRLHLWLISSAVPLCKNALIERNFLQYGLNIKNA